ncbi:uncharacterized protein [Primulina eburnea]|uniref:uncharacterized protein n=1 Tax=Primulina eburnea TaxID=1245227 RepID=UPI003C6C6121
MVHFSKVPIFSKEDFDDWKIRMQAHLVAQDDDMWSEWTGEDKKKANLDNAAKDIIYKTLNKNTFSKIKMCSTAKEIWEKLIQIFEGNEQVTENKLSVAMKKFENLKMKAGETLSEFDERFNSLVNELAALGKEYDNREIALKVMRALPRE